MPNKKSDIPFEKITLRLGVGDFAAMGVLFPQLGASVAIRTLVHNYVKSIQASLAPVELELQPDDLKDLLHDEPSA